MKVGVEKNAENTKCSNKASRTNEAMHKLYFHDRRDEVFLIPEAISCSLLGRTGFGRV